MKLTKRQLYDYRDVERPELMLIRAGQHLWALWKREVRANPRQDERQSATYAALETIWKAKREYRAERKAREAVWLDSLRQRMETANKARGR